MENQRNASSVLFWLLIGSMVGVAALLITFIMREYFRLTAEASNVAQEVYALNGPSPAQKISASNYLPPPYTFANKTIQLAWFYKPPFDGNLSLLADVFDLFILTKTDETVRDEIKQYNPDLEFMQYLRIEAIYDPGDCETQPYRNQVADRIGDFCMISEQHPDWFLLDQSGNRIMGSDRYVLMDPGNPGWRAFWLERAIISQEELGWDGVFLDNVEGSLNKRQRFGQLPAAYPTEDAYEEAILEFLEYIYTGYFQPQGRPLMANIVYFDDEFWFKALHYLDGVMDEGWAVGFSDKSPDPEEWEEDMRRAELTQAEGKSFILVSQGEQHDQDLQRFTFASYLLINYGQAYFRYTQGELYNATWLYPNYYFELGIPLGPRYWENGMWHREFEYGGVSVDPSQNLGIISIP